VSGDVGDEEASPVRIDGDEPIEVTGDGRHRTIGGADAQTGEFRNAARKDRGLYVAGDGEFVLDREQAAFVGNNLLHRYPSLRGHEQRKRDRFKQRVISEVEESPIQIVVEDSNCKKQGASRRDAALGQQAFSPHARDDIRCCQGKESADYDGIVVRHEPARSSVEKNGEYARESDGSRRDDHDLERRRRAPRLRSAQKSSAGIMIT